MHHQLTRNYNFTLDYKVVHFHEIKKIIIIIKRKYIHLYVREKRLEWEICQMHHYFSVFHKRFLTTKRPMKCLFAAPLSPLPRHEAANKEAADMRQNWRRMKRDSVGVKGKEEEKDEKTRRDDGGGEERRSNSTRRWEAARSPCGPLTRPGSAKPRRRGGSEAVRRQHQSRGRGGSHGIFSGTTALPQRDVRGVGS